jgi:hypothetical protein
MDHILFVIFSIVTPLTTFVLTYYLAKLTNERERRKILNQRLADIDMLVNRQMAEQIRRIAMANPTLTLVADTEDVPQEEAQPKRLVILD